MESRLFGTISEEAENQGIVFECNSKKNIIFFLGPLILIFVILAMISHITFTTYSKKPLLQKSYFENDKLVEILLRGKILLEGSRNSNELFFNESIKDEDNLRKRLALIDIDTKPVLSAWEIKQRYESDKILFVCIFIAIISASFFWLRALCLHKNIIVSEKGINVFALTTSSQIFLNWTDIKKAVITHSGSDAIVTLYLYKKMRVFT